MANSPPPLIGSPNTRQPLYSATSYKLIRIRSWLMSDSALTAQLSAPMADRTLKLVNGYLGPDEAQENAISGGIGWTSFIQAFFDSCREKTVEEEVSLSRCFSEIQKYKKKKTMQKADRIYATDWVRDIVTTQKKIADLVPPFIAMESSWGYAAGFTFVIKNSEQVCGYLYGTMHHLYNWPEGRILTKLSPITRERLCECSILGMECNLDSALEKNSVDGALDAVADEHGIATIGLDDDEGIAPVPHFGGESVLPEQCGPRPSRKKLDQIQELARYARGERDADTITRVKIVAMYSGIIELMRSASLTDEAVRPMRTIECQRFNQRNQTMVDNMDTLLKACKMIGVEQETLVPKCFFAIGVSHLTPTRANPESVVELLAKKGWTVKLLSKEGVQVNFPGNFPPSSHTLRRFEAENIAQLIEFTHYDPLYVHQS